MILSAGQAPGGTLVHASLKQHALPAAWWANASLLLDGCHPSLQSSNVLVPNQPVQQLDL